MTNEKPKPPPPPGKVRSVMRVLLTLAIISGGAYAAWLARDGKLLFVGPAAEIAKDERPTPAIPVEAHIAQQRDEPVIINGLGVVQAWNTVTVRSRVDGAIERIAFEEGAMVKEGETLVELDQRPFIAARDQARAKIAEDQALLKSAEADLERTMKLNKSGFASRQTFDQRTASVQQLKSQIVADKAALENAETQLSYTVIKAPISGRVGLRAVDIGNIVRDSDAGGVVTIAQVQPIAVIFTAPEQYLEQIRGALQLGRVPVAALSTAGKTTLAEGRLAVIDNTIDIASGSIRLKARFDNQAGKLWPGQSVNTRLTVATLSNAIVVPEGAILRGPSGPFAFVVKPDRTAEMRTVGVAQIQDGWAVIETGILAGEEVVTSGQYKVQPGAPLNVTNTDTKAANATPTQKGVE